MYSDSLRLADQLASAADIAWASHLNSIAHTQCEPLSCTQSHLEQQKQKQTNKQGRVRKEANGHKQVQLDWPVLCTRCLVFVSAAAGDLSSIAFAIIIIRMREASAWN